MTKYYFFTFCYFLLFACSKSQKYEIKARTTIVQKRRFTQRNWFFDNPISKFVIKI